MDIVDRDGGAARAQRGDGDVAQPDGLFDQGAGAIVFALEVPGLIVGIEHRAGRAASDLDSLPEGGSRRRDVCCRPTPRKRCDPPTSGTFYLSRTLEGKIATSPFLFEIGKSLGKGRKQLSRRQFVELHFA